MLNDTAQKTVEPTKDMKTAAEPDQIVPTADLKEMANNRIKPEDRHPDEVVAAHKKYFAKPTNLISHKNQGTRPQYGQKPTYPKPILG